MSFARTKRVTFFPDPNQKEQIYEITTKSPVSRNPMTRKTIKNASQLLPKSYYSYPDYVTRKRAYKMRGRSEPASPPSPVRFLMTSTLESETKSSQENAIPQKSSLSHKNGNTKQKSSSKNVEDSTMNPLTRYRSPSQPSLPKTHSPSPPLKRKKRLSTPSTPPHSKRITVFHSPERDNEVCNLSLYGKDPNSEHHILDEDESSQSSMSSLFSSTDLKELNNRSKSNEIGTNDRGKKHGVQRISGDEREDDTEVEPSSMLNYSQKRVYPQREVICVAHPPAERIDEPEIQSKARDPLPSPRQRAINQSLSKTSFSIPSPQHHSLHITLLSPPSKRSAPSTQTASFHSASKGPKEEQKRKPQSPISLSSSFANDLTDHEKVVKSVNSPDSNMHSHSSSSSSSSHPTPHSQSRAHSFHSPFGQSYFLSSTSTATSATETPAPETKIGTAATDHKRMSASMHLSDIMTPPAFHYPTPLSHEEHEEEQHSAHKHNRKDGHHIRRSHRHNRHRHHRRSSHSTHKSKHHHHNHHHHHRTPKRNIDGKRLHHRRSPSESSYFSTSSSASMSFHHSSPSSHSDCSISDSSFSSSYSPSHYSSSSSLRRRSSSQHHGRAREGRERKASSRSRAQSRKRAGESLSGLTHIPGASVSGRRQSDLWSSRFSRAQQRKSFSGRRKQEESDIRPSSAPPVKDVAKTERQRLEEKRKAKEEKIKRFSQIQMMKLDETGTKLTTAADRRRMKESTRSIELPRSRGVALQKKTTPEMSSSFFARLNSAKQSHADL
ncbi:uncharacterized protein MONOS_800 [Monocercomonoides exilis]|uniref:uncharacterized protein n=1 Tax=Monocercomonoides exilis TaxID=2049356 RepID=UPI0035593C86|nr:hypothetical protein MONOS_800 [Monocercomonoides exilis]|eukprot:MONOS_800.1-p1 / transcript=MONOS_800.1 / gene=MONOS_800 / organism=Monocercomonoides_exilis_PA203 / gene_product=unspecified product / transcript_product=unspecified product / location=Mono_scaffold00013:155178-157614(-) / protein_length=778 / sequence_SO=supercontig / SO=protein_coding / is_pseudo=false